MCAASKCGANETRLLKNSWISRHNRGTRHSKTFHLLQSRTDITSKSLNLCMNNCEYINSFWDPHYTQPLWPRTVRRCFCPFVYCDSFMHIINRSSRNKCWKIVEIFWTPQQHSKRPLISEQPTDPIQYLGFHRAKLVLNDHFTHI